MQEGLARTPARQLLTAPTYDTLREAEHALLLSDVTFPQGERARERQCSRTSVRGGMSDLAEDFNVVELRP